MHQSQENSSYRKHNKSHVRKNMLHKYTPEKDTFNGEYEFGGTFGALGIIIFSHFIVYYLWICIEFYNGNLIYPGSELLKNDGFLFTMFCHISRDASPTFFTISSYVIFLCFELFLATIMPGVKTVGLPIPSENRYRYSYYCNAYLSWYVLIATMSALHFSGIFPIHTVRENFGSFLTSAIIVADTISVIIYVSAFLKKCTVRMSGNHVYDFFMGSYLNPRLGNIDLKMFAEIRNSWCLLAILTWSSASKMYQETGTITGNMMLLLTINFLYVNACQKGEECVVTTWDITTEKFGWMLIYWNFIGVPFLYCIQPLFLQSIVPKYSYSFPTLSILFTMLFVAYYIWDTANSQKNRFRMERNNVEKHVIHRKCFPQLPWGYIPNPKTIKNKEKNRELFVDGWYIYARKIHYTADVVMSCLWSGACGFSHIVIPYFYLLFFISMLIHREKRDSRRCQEKYGKLWEKYVKLVPNVFIPKIKKN